MNKPTHTTAIPKLRFPEFAHSGEWEVIALSKLGEIVNGLYGKSSEDFGKGKPFVTYKQVYESSKVDFSKCGRVEIREGEKQNNLVKGDILFTTSSETPHEVGFASVVLIEPNEPTYLNSFCFSLRPFSLEQLQPEFSQYLFQSAAYRKSIRTLSQGITRFNISKSAFLKLKVFLPKAPAEQRKIADCLTSLDACITLEQKKLELLRTHKKGLLQQLFPAEGQRVPALRFPEFAHSGEWEVKRLGEILSEPLKEIEKKPNQIELLSVKLHCKGIENTGKYPTVTERGRPYYRRYKGELLIGRQNFHNGGIGIVKDENDGKICSNAISSYLPRNNDDIVFIFYYISREDFYKNFSNIVNGTGQKEITKKEFDNIKIHIPPLPEQRKIASCLASVDALIEAQSRRIEVLQRHKKGLLQGLFPRVSEAESAEAAP